MSAKTHQLQIRVSSEEKRGLHDLASSAGQTMSSHVLSRCLPPGRTRFGEILRALHDDENRRFALADLHDLLSSWAPVELREAVAEADLGGLSPYLQNYVAAMVEQATLGKGIGPPAWTSAVEPLAEPYFVTPLRSLRLHLLHRAPVAFKRRNIFLDSTIGDRV